MVLYDSATFIFRDFLSSFMLMPLMPLLMADIFCRFIFRIDAADY